MTTQNKTCPHRSLAAAADRTARPVLAALGDAGDPSTWSGIPYHLLASSDGLFSGVLAFSPSHRSWKLARARWGASRILSGRQAAGFQFTTDALEALWGQRPPLPRGTPVLNCFQLYPPSLVSQGRAELGFYIDMTLNQLFHYYGLAERIPRDVMASAIEIEKAQYAVARTIAVHAAWVAEDLVSNYGVAHERIRVVVPGANFEPADIDAWERRTPVSATRTTTGPLRLLFVGKDWRRKGLDRLLRALAIANTQGGVAELSVVGPSRKDLPEPLGRIPNVTWHGFIDKVIQSQRFFELCAACDVGVLLSRREAGGISLLEFARLGLPTIAPRTGGSTEFAVEGATHLISQTASDGEIADVIRTLASDRRLLATQRTRAWEARSWADWRRAAAQLRTALQLS